MTKIVLMIIGALYLFALMAGAIIVIILTKKKSTFVQKILHYMAIAMVIIIAICLLPIWINFIGEIIAIVLIILIVKALRKK